MAERDAAFAQVVRGQGDGDGIAGQDLDEMAAHFAGGIRDDHMAGLGLDAEF